MHIHIYIYIYIERERERDTDIYSFRPPVSQSVQYDMLYERAPPTSSSSGASGLVVVSAL